MTNKDKSKLIKDLITSETESKLAEYSKSEIESQVSNIISGSITSAITNKLGLTNDWHSGYKIVNGSPLDKTVKESIDSIIGSLSFDPVVLSKEDKARIQRLYEAQYKREVKALAEKRASEDAKKDFENIANSLKL
jgi:hypothetical protein